MSFLTRLFGRRESHSKTTTVTPRFEVLEDRTVPSTVVADFAGHGLWRYDTVQRQFQSLGTPDASALAVSKLGPAVVAVFPHYGTYEWTQHQGWHRITPVEATHVAVAGPGNIVAADFPGYGIYVGDGNNSWKQLTTARSSILDVDAAGDVVGEFPGYGVWFNEASSHAWKNLTHYDATQTLFVSTGTVVVDVRGYGLNEYTDYNGAWQRLTPVDAVSVSGIDGYLTASFAGYGTYSLSGGQWTRIKTGAGTLIGAGSAFAACVFPGQGTWFYDYGTDQWMRFSDAEAYLLGMEL
jgi:hypothetical protein